MTARRKNLRKNFSLFHLFLSGIFLSLIFISLPYLFSELDKNIAFAADKELEINYPEINGIKITGSTSLTQYVEYFFYLTL